MKITPDKYTYHPSTEKLVQSLATLSNSENFHFIRTVSVFYLGIVASTMRVNIELVGNRPVPLNVYAVGLLSSGAGKGVVTSELEKLLQPLAQTFTQDWELFREAVIDRLVNIEVEMGADPDKALERVTDKFEKLGVPLLWFEEGTSPAFKQMRSALVNVPFGSLNFIVDEVFNTTTAEVMEDLIKSYDVGELKQKLIKHTKDTPRVIDNVGSRVPANMLLFGTGDQLSSPDIHSAFYKRLVSGLGRRAIFAYDPTIKRPTLTVQERLDAYRTTDGVNKLESFQPRIAAMIKESWRYGLIAMTEEAEELLMTYHVECELKADATQDRVLSVETEHRYMKVAKIAGIYCLYDNVATATRTYIEHAIKFVEDGAESIRLIVKSTPPHMKLAEFLAEHKGELTMSALVTELPWFTGSLTAKLELLQLATEYGYTHNIIITQEKRRGILFIEGRQLEPTDPNKLIVSLSDHQAYNYVNGYMRWGTFHKYITEEGKHWVNHHVEDGHRQEANVIPGFNIVVLDVDNSDSSEHNVPLAVTMELLSDYKFLVYESKRSTPEYNRYRIVMLCSHTLHLSDDVYAEFMTNLYQWLPIPSDEVTNQRSRKWLGFNQGVQYSKGTRLVPVLDFIPDTERQTKVARQTANLGDLSNTQRWFAARLGVAGSGRNNILLKYALLLVDAGMAEEAIAEEIYTLNREAIEPMEESRIRATVLQTVTRKILDRPM